MSASRDSIWPRRAESRIGHQADLAVWSSSVAVIVVGAVEQCFVARQPSFRSSPRSPLRLVNVNIKEIRPTEVWIHECIVLKPCVRFWHKQKILQREFQRNSSPYRPK
jgi:hypothetical protein